MNRRYFMKSSGLALASLGVVVNAPSFLARTLTQTKGKRKLLVAIFQRGAMDGLNAVVPYSEQAYYSLRPTIAIPRPQSGEANAALDLDGQFGLHPALAPFKPLYDAGQLAIVHAVGSPDTTRSHFDAQDYMEAGTPGVKSTTDGWLNRYLQSKPAAKDTKASPFRAVAMGANMPRTMQGKAPALALTAHQRNNRRQRRGGGQLFVTNQPYHLLDQVFFQSDVKPVHRRGDRQYPLAFLHLQPQARQKVGALCLGDRHADHLAGTRHTQCDRGALRHADLLVVHRTGLAAANLEHQAGDAFDVFHRQGRINASLEAMACVR